MSTPIEIVREYRHWQLNPVLSSGCQWSESPHTRDEFDIALASVLRDAERFKALELAHNGHGTNVGWSKWINDSGECGWDFCPQNLAELADKLRSEK